MYGRSKVWIFPHTDEVISSCCFLCETIFLANVLVYIFKYWVLRRDCFDFLCFFN